MRGCEVQSVPLMVGPVLLHGLNTGHSCQVVRAAHDGAAPWDATSVIRSGESRFGDLAVRKAWNGIGDSPSRNDDGGLPSTRVVGHRNVSVTKEFASFLWMPAWLVLNETMLALHKSEVRHSPLSIIYRTVY
jgi:hypothetical protein